jgi:Domain of unknown function (DUF6907)
MTAMLRAAVDGSSGNPESGLQLASGDRCDTSARPYWLITPCPAWCESKHQNQDHPDDRIHLGPDVEVYAMTSPSPEWVYAKEQVRSGSPVERERNLEMLREHDDKFTPASFVAYLRQHELESEPRVWLALDESSDGLHLTLAETEQLAQGLTGLASAGRNGRP